VAFEVFGDRLADHDSARLSDPLAQGGEGLDLGVGEIDDRAHGFGSISDVVIIYRR